MKKNRAVSFIALLLNLAIVGLAAFSAYKLIADYGFGVEMFQLFTISASALLALSALLMVPCCIACLVKGEYKVPLFFKGLKFMGVVAVLTTLVLNVVSYLKPEFLFDFVGVSWFDFNYLPVFFIRFCLPVLAFLSFAFFEGGIKSNFGLVMIGIIPVIAYLAVYVILAVLGSTWADFYQMHRFGEVFGSANDLWYLAVIAVVLIAFILAIIVWLVNRGLSAENKKNEEKPAEQPAPVVNVVVNNNNNVGGEQKKEEQPAVAEEKPAPAPAEQKPAEQQQPAVAEEKPAPAPAEQKPAEQQQPAVAEEKPAPAPVEQKPEEQQQPAVVEEQSAPAEESPVEQSAPAVVAAAVVAENETQPEEEVAAADETQDEEVKKPVAKKPAAKKPVAKKPAAKPAAKKEEPKKPAPYSSKIYHISKQQNTGKWQIKVAGAERAVKLFDTQKDAIDYAKNLVKEKGGSYRVHSLQGKMRKA